MSPKTWGPPSSFWFLWSLPTPWPSALLANGVQDLLLAEPLTFFSFSLCHFEALASLLETQVFPPSRTHPLSNSFFLLTPPVPFVFISVAGLATGLKVLPKPHDHIVVSLV